MSSCGNDCQREQLDKQRRTLGAVAESRSSALPLISGEAVFFYRPEVLGQRRNSSLPVGVKWVLYGHQRISQADVDCQSGSLGMKNGLFLNSFQ
jgi:hypothetical protein